MIATNVAKNSQILSLTKETNKTGQNYQNEEFKFWELLRKLSVDSLCLTLLT